MKLVLTTLVLALSLAACGKKNKSGGGGSNKPSGGDVVIGPAEGKLQGTPFKPMVAGIKKSENNADKNTYYWVRMTDDAAADPCKIVNNDRFVGFYISQASPVGTYNLANKTGEITGAIFFHYNGGYNVDWIEQGTVQVTDFDVQTGGLMLIDIGSGENAIKGALFAQYCN